MPHQIPLLATNLAARHHTNLLLTPTPASCTGACLSYQKILSSMTSTSHNTPPTSESNIKLSHPQPVNCLKGWKGIIQCTLAEIFLLHGIITILFRFIWFCVPVRFQDHWLVMWIWHLEVGLHKIFTYMMMSAWLRDR
ncbi:hypothetical protein BZA77DRAFT_313675 [Pyronema omphalodes]|nr:hypothetical protein BZA77DRAFT_313675 [Pyronema omphalodes]